MEPVRFGVMGTAKIALEKVISGDAGEPAVPHRGDRLARPWTGRGGGSGAGHFASLWFL